MRPSLVNTFKETWKTAIFFPFHLRLCVSFKTWVLIPTNACQCKFNIISHFPCLFCRLIVRLRYNCLLERVCSKYKIRFHWEKVSFHPSVARNAKLWWCLNEFAYSFSYLVLLSVNSGHKLLWLARIVKVCT